MKQLVVLNFGNDEFDACRYFLAPSSKTVEEFERDRLEGDVELHLTAAENIGVLEFEEQIARLRLKGYVEIEKTIYCHVTEGWTDER